MADVPAPNYASFQSQPVNPLAIAGQAQGLVNAQSQNALIQQEIQNQAAQNPGIVAQSQRQQVGLTSDQAATSMQLYANRNKILGDLYEKTDSNGNPNVSQKDMYNAIIQHVADGSMSPIDGVNTMATFPKEDTPQANRAYLKLHIFQNQNNIDQLNTVAGQQGNLNLGDTAYQGQYNSAYEGGGFNPATSAQIGMSPEANASRIGLIDPNTGKPISAPQSSLVDRTGHALNNPLVQPSAQNSANPLAPNTGIRPPQWNGPNDAGNIPGAIQSGYTPGTEATANVLGDIAAKNYGQDVNATKTANNTIFNMKNALEALQSAKTGVGTGATQAIKSFAVAMDPSLQNTQWGNDVEAYDKANKYLTNQAQTRANAVGPNTNSNLAASLTGSPNVHINNLAAQDVQKVNLALTRMDYARTMAFQDQNPQGTPQQYQQFGPQFNQSVDPRGFMAEEMTKPQLQRTLQSLGPSVLPNGQPNPARQKFDNAYNMAIKYGLMNHIVPPSQPTSSAGAQNGQ